MIAFPLDTCLVADKKLGSMGKPHTFVHEGREIKFCCAGCDDEFKANTAKYIKKFDDAVASKKAAEATGDATVYLHVDNLEQAITQVNL